MWSTIIKENYIHFITVNYIILKEENIDQQGKGYVHRNTPKLSQQGTQKAQNQRHKGDERRRETSYVLNNYKNLNPFCDCGALHRIYTSHLKAVYPFC
jgi:hypothetical protein